MSFTALAMTPSAAGTTRHLLTVIGVLLIVALVAAPLMVGSRYAIYLGTLVALQCGLAASLNLILGYTGQFALSHSAFFGLGAYTSALLVMRYDMTFWGSLPATLALAAVVALAIGYPALRLTGGIHFALLTFGFGELVRLIVANWYDVTNGPQGLTLTYAPEPVFGLVFSTNRGMYMLAVACLLVILAVLVYVKHSRFGRACLAVREDETLAGSLGINVTWTKVAAFVLSSVLAALVGAVYAPFISFISPEMMAASDSVSMVGMLVVGGLGTLSGSIIGPLIFVAIPELLRFADLYRLVALGVIFILVALFMPSGIGGQVRKLDLLLLKRSRRTQ